MFEFLFKRPGDKPSDQQATPEQAAATAAASAQAEQTAARRAAQGERAKSLEGDEAGAVELILQSEFADVRLAAAAHVHTQPMLEKVQQAMRNTDRRVAKLMQSRLDALRHQQAERRQAEATIAAARKLLADEKLTPNQVAELDRMWKIIAAAPELADEFNGVRGALGKRLEDQVALQRAALDALAAVRRIAAGDVPAEVQAALLAVPEAAPTAEQTEPSPSAAQLDPSAAPAVAQAEPSPPFEQAQDSSAALAAAPAESSPPVEQREAGEAPAVAQAVSSPSAEPSGHAGEPSAMSAAEAAIPSPGLADAALVVEVADAGPAVAADIPAPAALAVTASGDAVPENAPAAEQAAASASDAAQAAPARARSTDEPAAGEVAPASVGNIPSREPAASEAAPASAANHSAPDAFSMLLDSLAAEHAKHVAAPESAALPRHLLGDFETAMADVRAGQAALQARRAALAGWLAAAPAALSADELARTWKSLPQHTLAAGLQPAFDALLAAVPATRRAERNERPDGARKPQDGPAGAAAAKTVPANAAKDSRENRGGEQGGERAAKAARQQAPASDASKEANKQFMATLDAMEAALAQGQLHIAADHDKVLKESKTGRLTTAQADRLAHVRAELKRLGDWARWGGNVSREELVKAVEDLQGQQLAMSELAKKVGSMRERWKALDGVSGPAPKGLWERFDSACTAAYAPAAAHFKHLADERHTNAAKAQAMISEIETMAAEIAAAGTPNYKGLAAASQRLRQAWSRLGAIDRKEKKKLDTAFGKAMDAMLAPLEQQRRVEVSGREELIEEALKLNPTDRHTLDAVRSLQERWQEHAKALPLERKQEQALWQRFRAACDAIFAARKESAHAADSERKAHLHVREDICAQLENASFSGDDKTQLAAMAKALKDAATAWHASGHVPRASEQRIEQRYKAAVAAVQAQSDAIRKRAGAAQANALRDKLRLVQALEAALTGAEAIDSADWEARWKALPPLAAEYERTLHARYAAALAAEAQGKRAAYAGQLEAGRAKLLQEVLRLEIVAGVDSGAEFARDRLKMQVEVLQSSLKSGQKPMTQAAQFLQLCAMPALADARTATRIEQLFRRIGADSK